MTSEDSPKFTEEVVSYGITTGDKETVPVVDDSKYQEEGMDVIETEIADSEKQLGKSTFLFDISVEQDEKEAINKENILPGDRLRHVKASYQEKGEEDLPEITEDTGKSSMVGTDAYGRNLR